MLRISKISCVLLVLISIFAGVCVASTTTGNIVPDPNLPIILSAPVVELDFNPEDYSFLVYDGQGDEASIQQAMPLLGITNFDVRTASNPVTLSDLASHDILIVGWNVNANTNGLVPSILESGIDGRILLTGHDADYHTVNGPEAGKTFLAQVIEYILQAPGTGLVVLAEAPTTFPWLPEAWGITATNNGSATVDSFTQDGLDSGVFDDLTPVLMSNWGQSYHNTFTEWGPFFVPFELGGALGDEVITIATVYDVSGLAFDKVDDVDDLDCRGLDDEITYTISWQNDTEHTFYNVEVVDLLPAGVTHPDGMWSLDPNGVLLPPDPAYDSDEHSYTWQIGTVGPGDSGYVELTVTVNEKAEPGMSVHNVAWFVANGLWLIKAEEDTAICCWDTGDIIYVDQTAADGNNNGVSWPDAYTDLHRALARAAESGCATSYTVYVAQGIYDAGEGGFGLADNLAMYGGFEIGGTDFADRDFERYETILYGNEVIISDPNSHVGTVTMGADTLVDGFTITDSGTYGIYSSGSDFTVENCVVENSKLQGINAVDGDVVVKWCQIRSNTKEGLYHVGEGYTVNLENCKIVGNKRYGLRIEHSTPTIKNCVISNNGSGDSSYQGIRIIQPASAPILWNNTILHNEKSGILFFENDPNATNEPDIQNCILWYNNDGGSQLAGIDLTQYSCVYDPVDDPNGVDFSLDAYENFSGNPGFAYGDPNDFIHLAYDSPCIDKGSGLLTYTDQLDIDGEDRVYGTYADIGADEVYSCDGDLTEDDIYNPLDFNSDGIVNYFEFAGFADSWGMIDTDPNWSGLDARYDYVVDGEININDLAYWADSWCWIACWKQSQMDSFGSIAMAMGGESMPVLSEAEGMMAPMSMGFAMEPIAVIEPEPVEKTEQELALFVKGIYEVIEYVDVCIDEDVENSENLDDLKAFLKDVLLEIKDEYLKKELK